MSERPNRKPETGGFFARDRAWHAPALTPGYKTSVLRARRSVRCYRSTARFPRPPVRSSATR
ncbi:hypothetical protein ACVIRM_006456 [Rhizobium laguerreae]